MIKLMLVAGKNSQSLATFLEQRGTFTVDFVYNDLANNTTDLLQSVLKVDKLVYIYQIDEGTGRAETNIRLDMQTLREMLLQNKFFKAEEILFLCSKNAESGPAKKYFSAVMEECGFKNYAIRAMDSMASFSSVYDNLIGVTLNKDFTNSYRKLYRRSRGDDAIMAYEPTDDRDVSIEAFDYEELKMWDQRKSLVSSIESTELIEDSDDYKHTNLPNPKFQSIVTKDVLPEGDLILTTGAKKTGKSTWGTVIANSAILNNKKTILYDLTRSQSCKDKIVKHKIELEEISPWEVIHHKQYTQNSFCCFGYPESLETFLGYILLQRFSIYDTVILVMDEVDLGYAIEILGGVLTCIVDVIYPFSYDVINTAKAINRFSGRKITPINIAYEGDCSLENIKLEIPGAKIIKPYKITDYAMPWIYQKIIEGE